ncbi:MAG: hypothetical protein ABSG95_14795, partial [Solirubrobacteraceae bacterium]
NDVIETAVQTVTAHLRESPVGERLAALPPGVPELVRRPGGRLESRPDFQKFARARWNGAATAAVAS